MTSLDKTTLKVTASVNVPIDKVWEYWTKPKHIMQWNNASDDWHTPKATVDLRIGGDFSSRMEAKDGSFGFDFTGKYTDIIPNKVIDYIMEDGRTVEIRFESDGSTTEIHQTFEAETENSLEMQQQGWQAIMNNFKKYIEQKES